MGEFKGFRPSRMSRVDVNQLSAKQRELYDEGMSRSKHGLVGPLNVLIRSPAFSDVLVQFGDFANLPDSGLSPRLRELAILIVARFWDADYEWRAHAPKALGLGIPRSALEDLRAGRPPTGLSDDEVAIWDFLHTLLRERRASDAQYERAKAILGEVPLIHLLGFVGHYGTLALILNATETHAIEPPEDELEMLYPS